MERFNFRNIQTSVITGLSRTIKEAETFKNFNSKNTKVITLLKKVILFE